MPNLAKSSSPTENTERKSLHSLNNGSPKVIKVMEIVMTLGANQNLVYHYEGFQTYFQESKFSLLQLTQKLIQGDPSCL
jgi:hypothetical protein